MKKRSIGTAAAAVLATFAALVGTSATAAVAQSAPGSVTTTSQITATGTTIPVKGDFDGDGRDDVYFYVPGSGADYLWSGKARNDTNSTTQADRFDVTTLPITGSYTPIVGDFNGDGKDDVFWYAPGPQADYLWLFTGRGTVDSLSSPISGSYKAVVGDFNQANGLNADDIVWYNNDQSYLWTTSGTGTFTSTSILNPPNDAKVIAGNWRQTAVSQGAPEYLDLFFYVPGPGADAIWAGNGNTTFTSSSVTINGYYEPVAGNWDANASGVDMTDMFWYAPGTAADAVWMNTGTSFTSSSATVNGRYAPVVIESHESTTQDDIFWSSSTSNDTLWVTNGTNGAFSYTSTTQAAWGASDIGARSPIVGDFNIADASSGGSAEASLSAGGTNTCAVSTAGAASCWGTGNWFFSTSTNRTAPEEKAGLTSGIAQVSTGIGVGCARTTGGAVKCWGFNAAGQLGDGTTNNSTSPVQVSGLTSGVTWISVGDASACAVLADTTVKCWGGNFFGQLGNGTTTMSSIPVTVTGVTGAVKVEVSANGSSVCATLAAGGAKCWGGNTYGQLANGSTADTVSTAVTATQFAGAVDVDPGRDHSCATYATGAVKCVGRNQFGQLGDSSNVSSTAGVTPSGLTSGVTSVDVGADHTCALMTTGALKCWGRNASGQLGIGTLVDLPIPFDASGLSSGVVTVSAGATHTCVLLTGGTAKCFGANGVGQVGNGSTATNVSSPATVTGSTVWSTGASTPTGNVDVLWWTAGDTAGQSEVLWYDLDSLT